MSGCRGAVIDGDGDGDGAVVPIGLLAAVDETGKVRESHVLAARLAVERVNQSGGLVLAGRHRRVELNVSTTSEDPRNALASALELVNRRRVVALIGPYALASARPVATLADANGVPMILPVETFAGPAEGGSFVFRTTPRDAEQGLLIARFVREELEGKRVAVVHDPGASGSAALAKSFRVGTTGFGGAIVSVDFGVETVSRVREARVDAVVLLLEPEIGVGLAREVLRAGIDAELIGIDMGDAFSWTFGGLDRVTVVVAWSPEVPIEAARDFVKRFSEQQGAAPGTNDALTYDAVGLVLEAITRAGSADPDAIQRSLRRLTDYQGVTGAFTYDGSGRPTKALAAVEVRGGEVRFRRWLLPFGR